MKKQTLFNLASMPKMILSITLIVMLGLLFGATSYLLKTSKTDLPIVNPVAETQCEIDSDCKLVSISGPCTSCNTSDEEYQCLPKEEAIKIIKERQRILNDPEGPCCSLCMPMFEVQHTCKCENGKCEKVKIEIAEEVVITTDKTEYEMGEVVKITTNNNTDKNVRTYIPLLGIERFDNNNWVAIKMILGMCGAMDGLVYDAIESYGVVEYTWDQEEKSCDNPKAAVFRPISKQVPVGRYKIKSVVLDLNNADQKKIIYSNEFTIKEKPAFDARCGEKVMGIGLCKRSAIGYEFDSNLEKCVEKRVGGCSFEIPFETLEECQDVCEKNNCAGNNELVYASHINSKKPSTCCDNKMGIKLLRQLLPSGLCQMDIPLDGAIGRCVLKEDESYLWGVCGNGICNEDENKCNCPEDCGDEKNTLDEQKFYCEKDNDCLATCSSPGCYNKNWYETVIRGDCEFEIRHSCRCIENNCVKQPLLKEDIEREIKNSNYCNTEDDCVRADSSCSLGCNVIVNKNKVERINKLISIIKGKCLVNCGEFEKDLDCVDNKCIIFR